MKKTIEKKLEITSNNRDVDRLYQEFFSMDKNIAEFKFTLENLTANKVICLFYFKKSKRYSTVDATIEDNAFTVKFDTSLITMDEPVVGYIYFEEIEKSADVYSFQFNVRVSELDKSKNAPVIEQKTGRIVDIDSIVTRSELEEILKTIHIESAAQDNSEIIKRLATLEAKPEIDTSQFATKEEIQNISLTPGPRVTVGILDHKETQEKLVLKDFKVCKVHQDLRIRRFTRSSRIARYSRRAWSRRTTWTSWRTRGTRSCWLTWTNRTSRANWFNWS